MDGSDLEDRHLRPGRRAQHCTPYYYEADDGQSHNESLDARGILVNRPEAFDKLLPIPSVDFALESGSTKRFVDDYEYIRIYLLQDIFDARQNFLLGVNCFLSVQADVGGG